MTPIVRLAFIFFTLFFSACASTGQLRKSFARTHRCNVTQVTATPSGRGFILEGCGQREFCQSSRGPCQVDVEQLMLRARATFARMKQCAEVDVQVMSTAQGIAVSGCGGYAICPGSANNCFAATPPSCQDLARTRFDNCQQVASSVGSDGRDPRYYPNSAGAVATDIARNVSGTIAEDRQLGRCQAAYQIELGACCGNGIHFRSRS